MQLRFLLFCWLCLSLVVQTFGQKDNRKNLFPKKQFVFWNYSNIIDPNGSSLQFGYNYQAKPWMDLQIELGFVSDNLIPTDLPFKEYAGFRIRPQIKFLPKNSVDKRKRFYGSVLLSYQYLNFNEINNFEINGNFNQNITFSGRDQTFAWYIVGGVDKRYRRIVTSFSIGIGKVYLKTRVTEGDIPENAEILRNCALFCRNPTLNSELNRTGVLFDLKIGYQF